MTDNAHSRHVRHGHRELWWDRVADIVVVGTGAAGCSAALYAAQAGAEVLMVEKREAVGGTTAKSGGWFWIPNHSRLREMGVEDPKPDALRYMARLTRPEAYDPDAAHLGLVDWEFDLIEAFYDNAAAAEDGLREMGALRSVHAAEFPDYYAHLPENRVPNGRVLIPESPTGELGTGADMIDQMMRAIDKAGIEVLREHPVQTLVLDDDGRAVGVIVDRDGSEVALGARQAVIFATGGFGQDPELRRQLLAGPILVTCAAPGSTGDFLRIAVELGLPLRNTSHPWMSPGILERGLRNRPDNEMTFQATGDSMIEVDRTGRRVTNEKLQYNEQTLAHWRWDAQRAEYGNLLLFMIWDEYAQNTFASNLPGNPIAPTGEDDDHVLSGVDLPALAEALQKRLAELGAQTGGVSLEEGFSERLAESIARFNEHARSGHDSDFHRGETPIETFFNSFHGPVRSETSPTMAPIADTGPYYATILAPGMLDSKGGPVIDADGRVLDAAGKPVPGLYGVGNCVASPSGKAYWAGGATLGPALTFGYLAGRRAAREPVSELTVSTAA